MYDTRNRFTYNQRNKRRGLAAVAPPPPPFTPPSIPDLGLWFPDFNLQHTGGNTFSWLDEVSQTILITGNYGTGSGITTLNGLNVLNSIDGNASINSNILNSNQITFVGLIDYQGIGVVGGSWFHCLGNVIKSFECRVRSDAFIDIYIYSSSFLRYSIESPANVVNPIILVTQFNFNQVNGGLRLIHNGNVYTDNNGISVPPGFASYDILDTPSFPNVNFKGSICEFMYYHRRITDIEINQVGNYLADKYNVAWTDI